MKRFKKVLALVLAGVLALAMLTACDGTTDPDKVIPDIDTANVVDTVNHMAADSKEGLGQVYYSAKYSEITKELLNNWLENREKSVTYAEEYQKIVAKMGGNAKIVVGLTDKNVIPGLTSGNPAVKGSPSMMCCSKIPAHTIWQTESVWRLSKRKMAQSISWSACST